MLTAHELRHEFLLDLEVTFLNHGAYGSCPRPVFEARQDWQGRLERSPIDFMRRDLAGMLNDARVTLASYVGAEPDRVAWVQNATTGVNIAARSLGLASGDEVLTTSLEYRACDLTWEWVCRQAAARLVRAEVRLPVASPAEVVDAIFARCTQRTRAIFVSHITADTGLRLPVQEIVARARGEGLISIIDGAHAVGQIPLDIAAIGADFYAGNCHKWLSAPKGAGFLYVSPDHQGRVDAPIVSWGYQPPSAFIPRLEEQGTRDPSPHLAVPEAIRFHDDRDWPAVRHRAGALARDARGELCELLGSEPLGPDEMIAQMATVRLPAELDGVELERHLRQQRIEVAVNGPATDLLRISIAGYTDRSDVDRLLTVLRQYVSDH